MHAHGTSGRTHQWMYTFTHAQMQPTPALARIYLHHVCTGASVTLYGLGFGLIDFSATAQLSAKHCQTLSWHAHTKLHCISGDIYSTKSRSEVPHTPCTHSRTHASMHASAHVFVRTHACIYAQKHPCMHWQVTVGAVIGTALGLYTFDAPAISRVWRNMPLTGGASLSMIGLNFGVAEHVRARACACVHACMCACEVRMRV